MAPLPSNNTGVLFIDYTSVGQRHSAEVRLPAGSGTTEAIAAYNALKAPMAGLMFSSDSITGARWRDAGQTNSFAIAVTALAGSNSGTPDPDRKPVFISWTGRGGGGRRCRFTLFTPFISLDAVGFRNNSPGPLENAVRTALLSAAVEARDIEGNTVFWNTYTNYGANSYFQRKARRTGT